jgi:putative chitinase
MGVRQNGPLGLSLHLDEQFAVPLRDAMLSARLVMPGPIGVPHWWENIHAARAKHEARRGHLSHTGHKDAPRELDASLQKSLERQPLLGGLTVALLQKAIPTLSTAAATSWVGPLNAACSKYRIDRSLLRMAAFLGHIAHESGDLRKLVEGLGYTTLKQLRKTFKVFRSESDEEASAYLGKAQTIANKVYAHRNGNGNTASGDGWKYRGRGLIQVTGKANYAAFGREAGVDVVNNPDLLATPRYAAASAGSFWKRRKLNDLADAEMYEKLSLRINSSLKSFPAREAKRKRALNALCLGLLGDVTLALHMTGTGPGPR